MAGAVVSSHPLLSPNPAAGIQLSSFLLLSTLMRDPKGQILPLGPSVVLPWLHTGMFNPPPAAFQAVLFLIRKAPNTFLSHGGVVGPPARKH